MCGLFGFIGKEKQQIDWQTLLSLGIDNDSRGGDSCGIFIDGEVEYGIDKNKLFSSFAYSSELIKKTEKAKIIIGHDRKASIGSKTILQAQPVVIYNTEDPSIVDFVLIHNGTIENYKELGNKYLTDIDERLTDSQIMAYIMYYHGYDVLKEYVGAGVFITVDYRQNKHKKPVIHLFKGKSQKSQYDKTLEEERPLYILNTHNGYWFSSLPEYLWVKSFKTTYKLGSLQPNVLYMIDEKNKWYKVGEYDRSQMCQKTYHFAYQSAYPSVYGYYTGQNSTTNKEENKTSNNTTTTPVLTEHKNTFRQVNLKYFLNSHPATGSIRLDKYGNITTDNNKTGYLYYFYGGHLVCGKAAFEALNEIGKIWGTSPTETIDCLGDDLEILLLPIFDNYRKEYTFQAETIKSLEIGQIPFQKDTVYTYSIIDGKLNKSKDCKVVYTDYDLFKKYRLKENKFNHLGKDKILQNIL